MRMPWPRRKTGCACAAKTAAGKAAEPVSGSVNQIDVQQAQLNQKEIRENWVSYNGDYTGRRFSSMAEVTPENVRTPESGLGVSHAATPA